MADKPTRVVPIAWRFILALWIPIWAFFLLWPLLKNPSILIQSLSLFRADAETRRAWAYGETFATFLRFCKSRLPEGSRFRIVGIDYGSIDRVRAFYFLYPSMVDEHAEFILVYQTPGYREDNTSLYALLNTGCFILRSAQPAIP